MNIIGWIIGLWLLFAFPEWFIVASVLMLGLYFITKYDSSSPAEEPKKEPEEEEEEENDGVVTYQMRRERELKRMGLKKPDPESTRKFHEELKEYRKREREYDPEKEREKVKKQEEEFFEHIKEQSDALGAI